MQTNLGFRMQGLLASSLVFMLCGLAAGDAHAFTPYRLIVQAARSPERLATFAHDKRLKIRLRKALLGVDPESVLQVSAYVSGGHAYLVGWVEDSAQRKALEDAAQGVPGLVSVAIYLPAKPAGENAPDTSAELKLKAKVTAAILAASGAEKSNISVEVLGTHVVLVGIVHSTEDIQAAGAAAQDTHGVSGVTSFLHVPPPKDARRLRGLLR